MRSFDIWKWGDVTEVDTITERLSLFMIHCTQRVMLIEFMCEERVARKVQRAKKTA